MISGVAGWELPGRYPKNGPVRPIRTAMGDNAFEVEVQTRHAPGEMTGSLPKVEGEGADREPTIRNVRLTRLLCVAGADLGASFRMSVAPVVIGRGAVDVKLQATDISRQHARITPGERHHVIEDLYSSNGTFLNGVRVVRPTPVQVGDRIQVGTTILVLTLLSDNYISPSTTIRSRQI